MNFRTPPRAGLLAWLILAGCYTGYSDSGGRDSASVWQPGADEPGLDGDSDSGSGGPLGGSGGPGGGGVTTNFDTDGPVDGDGTDDADPPPDDSPPADPPGDPPPDDPPGDPGPGDPGPGDPGPGDPGPGADFGNCGWDAGSGWYACGGSGENAANPIECPAGLVSGQACGGVDGVGCCAGGGDNWYCGNNGTLVVDGCGGANAPDVPPDPPPPVGNAYLDRANAALDDWQIGLQPNVTAGVRNFNGGSYNPKNWVTVADSSCNASGVPANMQGAGCALGGGTVGVCEVRFYNTGEIFDSTAIMLQSFQDGGSTLATKIGIFTHEVGHCLGLKHTDSTQYIMYPTSGFTATPHAQELAAVADAYVPVGAPSAFNVANFFQASGGGIGLRQFTFPVFTTSANIGVGIAPNMDVLMPPPGPPLEGDYMIMTHAIQADGSCIETLTPGFAD